MNENNNPITNTSTNDFFSLYNLFLSLCFLATYLIAYLLGNMDNASFGRAIDILFFLFILITILLFIYLPSETKKIDIVNKAIKVSEDIFQDPNVFDHFILFGILFYILIVIIRVPLSSGLKPFIVLILESKIFFTLFLVFINEVFKKLFDINLVTLSFDKIRELWSSFLSIKEKHKEEEVPTVTKKREVFNISNNLYTFDDAQAICQTYNSKLATYKQVKDSYNDGGDWCNYGWSDSQMILYPTQKKTWDALQLDSTTKNNCGKPGVNGGYYEDKTALFGVNCYGEKPSPTSAISDNIPKSDKDVVEKAKTDFWKENSDKMLIINPFNETKWNDDK